MLVVRLLSHQRRWDLASVFPEGDSDIAERIKRSLNGSGGLILVAGPARHGKSSTLAAMLGCAASPERAVASIEGPVEARVPGVYQLQVCEKRLPYVDAIKVFMRWAVDVIAVGEIDNLESLEAAITASQTGHTMLSTVSAKNAATAVTRLAHLGGGRYESMADQIADELRLVVAQRLVKRLCLGCSADGEPRGCSSCANGYADRVALAETLEISDDVMTAIATGQSASVLKKLDGYRCFEEHAAALVANRVTTQTEICRVLGAEVPDAMLERGAAAAGGKGS